ncbi:hypothetical protein VNO80_22719 [Phaseolus coccineus]|uniref:Uncharacterized protein n=1 Tax=Phaseolus coccineus TaxID=3886 RepID=A0AAN9QUJ4_PHACN
MIGCDSPVQHTCIVRESKPIRTGQTKRTRERERGSCSRMMLGVKQSREIRILQEKKKTKTCICIENERGLVWLKHERNDVACIICLCCVFCPFSLFLFVWLCSSFEIDLALALAGLEYHFCYAHSLVVLCFRTPKNSQLIPYTNPFVCVREPIRRMCAKSFACYHVWRLKPACSLPTNATVSQLRAWWGPHSHGTIHGACRGAISGTNHGFGVCIIIMIWAKEWGDVEEEKEK